MKNNIHRFLIFLGMTIFTINTNAQRVITHYQDKIPEFFHDNEEVKKSVARIAELINNGASISRLKSVEPTKEIFHTWGSEKNIRVLEDRIEFTKKDEMASVHFTNIINSVAFGVFYGKITVYFEDYGIEVKGKEASQQLKREFELLKEKNKSLYYENRKSQRKSQLILFEKNAAEYRALKVKPPVSEEQRKFIVQANAFTEKKMYNDAIRLYEQAIEVDQTAYPAAYSNLALLSAQVKQYNDAIYHMKKYLLLVPDASDARGAQDKIYEWEAQIVR